MASQTLKADRDAYVDEASPDSNFGGGSRLFIRSQGGVLGDGDRRLYASFDLSELPADAAEILTATLRLQPEETSVLERTLEAHEVTGAWTEGGITWNAQPAVDTDHGTQLSSEDPQEWDVLSSVQGAFPGGRAEFRIKDATEGSADGPEQEYISREGVGAEPELVLTFKKEATSDLSSTVTPANNRVADLSTQATPKLDGQRFRGLRAKPVEDGDAIARKPYGIAYDADRDKVWIIDRNTGSGNPVLRYSPWTLAFDQAFTLDDFPIASAVAYDGTHLWISHEDTDTIRKYSIGATTLTEEASYDHADRRSLAWDGQNLWSLEQQPSKIHKHNMDATLSVASTLNAPNAVAVLGIAFPDDTDELWTLEEEDGEYWIRARSTSDFSKLNERRYTTPNDTPDPTDLAFVPGDLATHLYTTTDQRQEVHIRTPLTLASSVTVGKLIGSSDLTSTVQPGNIPASADLDSQVKPGNGADADLSSTVTPRPQASSDLGTTVQPGGVSGSSDLTTTVRPSTTQVDVQGRATGSVAPVIPVDADDFAEISAEIGSEITHTQDGSSSSLRRVVQLVDTQTAKTFPREATSEHGRSSTQDKLGRGDGILYAKKGDTFQPGDQVTYDGLTWRVVGLLGWEIVGDERIYQEVGLRRLSVTATGRAKGTVQISESVDLVSEVTVNVP